MKKLFYRIFGPEEADGMYSSPDFIQTSKMLDEFKKS